MWNESRLPFPPSPSNSDCGGDDHGAQIADGQHHHQARQERGGHTVMESVARYHESQAKVSKVVNFENTDKLPQKGAVVTAKNYANPEPQVRAILSGWPRRIAASRVLGS